MYINVNQTIDFICTNNQQPIFLSLSQMVTGCRFTSADPRGMKMLDQVSVIFTQGAKVICVIITQEANVKFKDYTCCERQYQVRIILTQRAILFV